MAAGATLANLGMIQGGEGGAAGTGIASNGTPGAGGAGVIGAGLNVLNSGAIIGGLSGDGATLADAIDFTGGVNSLTLLAGSGITGNVVAFSVADSLVLGGRANGSFDVSQIGPTAQYEGFGVFEKTGSSTWTLENTTSADTPWVINGGTLAVSSDANLGNSSNAKLDTLSFGGGTLEFLSSGIPSFRERPDFGAFRPSRTANGSPKAPHLSWRDLSLDDCETRTRTSGLVIRNSPHQNANLQLHFGP